MSSGNGVTTEDYVEIAERSSGGIFNNGDNPNFNKSGPNDVDRVLYNDLVEIVPLVQSLIDRSISRSFTRRGSMIYNKTPSRKNDRKGVKSKLADKVQGKHSKNDTEFHSAPA